MIQEEKNTICGICPAGCWVTATLSDGKLVRVRPQADHLLGMICKLGEHSPDIVYSKHRIRTPLKRKGPKGNYDFEPISWDQAFEIIVAKLQDTKARYGAEAAAIYTGRGSFDQALCDVFQPKDTAVSSASSVLFPFGSPNTFGVGALCYVSYAMIAPHATMGEMLITTDSELENAQLIVVWGTNPGTDSPPIVHRQILDEKANGAEVIVIDPRRTETVKETDAEWIPIRPGTDGALALAMIQTLIEEDLYDEEFVEKWTVGFEELKQYVQHFTPENVEEITGIPARVIRSLAIRIKKAHGASPVMYTGLEYSDSGVQAIRATQIFWALAGQLDVPGGRVIKMRENAFPVNKKDLVANPDIKKAIGRDRFPVYSQYRGESHAIALPEAVLEGRPYPIKTLLVLGASVITSWPQPEVWRKTLERLDFLVTIDRQLTADSAYADIVLPATTGYENTSYMVYGNMLRIREKLIEPVGEARNDFFILAELAERLGYGELYPQSEEELLDHALKGTGHSAYEIRLRGGIIKRPKIMKQYKKWEKGLLRPDGQPGFNTPSGKFEIASGILAEHGYDPLPVYTEPKEGPLAMDEITDKYPLVFNSGARRTTDFRSQHHGIDSLVKEAPEPEVAINTMDARQRGIKTGDSVYVATQRGQVRFKALVTDDITRGTIDANMGGGGPVGPEAWQKSNVNDLTDLHRYDPISGFPTYKALLCDVQLLDNQIGSYIDEALPEELVEAFHASTSTHDLSHKKPKAMKTVYLDHNSTTPLDSRVFSAMEPFFKEDFGNPSSIHSLGIEAKDAIDAARRVLAQALNTTARRIIFTGGGSEADNLAIKGLARAYQHKGKHIITSAVEHPAVLSACRSLAREGFYVTYLPVGRDGLVDPAKLASAIKKDTILVSIMNANNETGVIQPISELAAIAKEQEALFHTDAVQAFGKIPLDIEYLGIDALSISAHKIYGPKGIGALYLKKGIVLEAQVDGGSQEGGLRAGTENVAGIAGFAKGADLAVCRLPELSKIRDLRDRLQMLLLEMIPGAKINGSVDHRLVNTLNVTLPGYRGESLVLKLDRLGIALSSGSACKSGSPEPSHALLAMGLSPEEAHCALRFSLGHENTDKDIEMAIEALEKLVKESANSIRFVPCR